MKIILLDGGLGNQAFQYIFCRFLEENSGDVVYLDDRYFFNEQKTHNGYELNKVWNLKPNLLSEYFDADVWDEILKITKEDMHIIDFLNANGLNMLGVSEGSMLSASCHPPHNKPYKSVECNGYHPDIAKFPGNVYYYGYWINGNYFKSLLDKIIVELTFPKFDDDSNKNLAGQITSCSSVGVHVRRGDFVDLGWALSPGVYNVAVPQFKMRIKNPVFFIFSDDITWCEENRKSLGFERSDEIVYVSGNKGENAFRDMQLMTLCEHLIIANSSFSYLAALLNRNPNKMTANPTTRLIV
ncbi:MAG: alpha-1,2-fucosyltransferase [Oscillospiraceae bacterium]|jgi:hypothetical protein|nr:alpha-1,2-fucosyltransferase [Oscillospiraceae bacterium]